MSKLSEFIKDNSLVFDCDSSDSDSVDFDGEDDVDESDDEEEEDEFDLEAIVDSENKNTFCALS